MTQRVFDVENEKDMADLWDILPDDVIGLKRDSKFTYLIYKGVDVTVYLFKINWHDKTEITRPIQEATTADLGKLCVFWNDINRIYYGVLTYIGYSREMPYYARNDADGSTFNHCRRLTKQEIEELC